MLWNCGLLVGAMIVGQTDLLPHIDSLTEELRAPARLNITTDGTVLVTDPYLNHVARFGPDGTFIGTSPVPESPIGIAAHPDGRYFVTYRDDPRVGIHDAAFNRIGFLGQGIPLVNYVRPTDVKVASSTGRIYVADSGGHRIYGFEAGGSLALILGTQGEQLGQFRYPSAIAVDASRDRLYVADQDNFRVQVFTTAGLYIQRFGYRNKFLVNGDVEGWMPRGSGLALNADGQVYVADAFMSTIRLFGLTGVEIAKVVDYGSPLGVPRTVTDVALSPDGERLYVVSTNTGSVEVYDATALGGPAGGEPNGGAFEESGTNWSLVDAAFARENWAAKLLNRSLQPGRVPNGSPIATGEHGGPEATSTGAGFDGPHMAENGVICGRCHSIVGQPGVHVGTVEGQAALCFSCHNSSGQAMNLPLNDQERLSPATGPGRSHAWWASAVNPSVGSAGPLPGGEMHRYLAPTGLIKCATCHNQHSSEAGSPYLRRHNVAGAMCKECHTERIDHTPGGPWQPDCNECHRPHDPSSVNLALVSSVVYNRTLDVDKEVVFTSQTGPHSFSDGNPLANDGICQVCHVSTTYHRHDGTGSAHNEGANCTSCHPHQAGFIPTGGDCTGCHASAQDNGDGIPSGGRRGIVPEFPVADAHAHYGASLDSAACVVCHDQTTHMDGFVDLLDPDSGPSYRFQLPQDLTSDPDLSNFCAACHDADGAARLASPMDPFGNGNTPPDVMSRFAGTLQWDELYGDFCFGNEGTLRAVNSHHDISDADQAFSGAKIECLNCHGAHNVSAAMPMADPFDTKTAWTGTTSEFCLACHAGGTGPLDPQLPTGVVAPVIDPADARWTTLGMDWSTILGGACLTESCSSLRGLDSCDYVAGPWYVDYSWTHSAHGLDSKRSWNGYSGAPSAILDCTVCHEPHGSTTIINPSGNPYLIRDAVDGTPFVDDGTRTGGFNGPPWNTFGVSQNVTVAVSGATVDWGSAGSLCSTCHADWLPAYDFHGFCSSCQTCHAHGAAWGEHDWVGDDDMTPCP